MRIAITGASGFIGRHVSAALDVAGIECVSLGRARASVIPLHIPVDLLRAGDLSDLMAEIRATHLIHLAWCTEHGKFWDSPLNLEWVAATSRLVDAFARAGGQHVMVAGTCAEYDWRYGYCREEITPLVPATLYGEAKYRAHEACIAICNRHRVALCWGRIFFPYGPGEDDRRLIPSLFGALRGEKVPFGVNLDSYRDLLHVTDLARAIVLCAERGFDGPINLCSGRPLALRDVVLAVAAVVGTDPYAILREPPARRDGTRLLVGDNTKIEALGWAPSMTLRAGLFSY